MIGEKFVGDLGEGSSLKRPANFNMSKTLDGSFAANTIYDDTGRNH